MEAELKTWDVRIKITSFMDIEVQAATEEEAINAAIENVNIDHLVEWEATGEGDATDISETNA
jgi:hypothetical protein